MLATSVPSGSVISSEPSACSRPLTLTPPLSVTVRLSPSCPTGAALKVADSAPSLSVVVRPTPCASVCTPPSGSSSRSSRPSPS